MPHKSSGAKFLWKIFSYIYVDEKNSAEALFNKVLMNGA